MKYAKWISVLMLLLISAVAVAQMPASDKIVTQVPFTFVVANHVIPLGECSIQRGDSLGRVLVIRSPGANVNVFATASLAEISHAAPAYSLVFHRYGTRYYLAGVKLENSRVFYSLTRSSLEDEALAQNLPATEKVLVAAAK